MAKNPFVDDAEDEQLKKANQADVEKVREAVRESPDDEEVLEVDVDKLEAEDEDKAEGDSKTRQERRRDRYAANRQEAQDARDRADRLEREAQEERTRRIALETQLQTQQRQAAPEQEADPEGQEILRIRAERKALHQAYTASSATLTPQEKDEYERRAYQLNDMESYATYQRNQRLSGANRPQQGMRPEDIQREVKKQHLMNTYPDVFASQDRRVTGHVVAAFTMLVNQGEPDNEATIAKAVATTRRAFNIGPKPSPTSSASRARLSSGGTGAGAGASGGEGITVKMGATQRKMAEALFPHMKPEQAHKQWAKTAGKRLAEKGKGA